MSTIPRTSRPSSPARIEGQLSHLPPSSSTLFDPLHRHEGFQEKFGDALSSQSTVHELPPVDRGKKAWAFCISACVIETMVWGFGFSYGIFQEYYTTHPPFDTASPVAISAVGTVALALQYAECLFVLLVFRRYPEFIKPSMYFSLALITICFVVSSFANKVWQLLLLQGVGVGIGGGLLYVPVILWIPEWFVERRGLAGGIIFGGTGIGGFVFPLILDVLLDKVGFRWTLRIWAALTLGFCGVAFWGFQPRVPLPKFRSKQIERQPWAPPQLPFLGLPVFWGFLTSNIFQALSFFPVSIYIAVFTTFVSTPLNSTVVLSLFNVASVLGQVVLGHLSDSYPYFWVMISSGSGCALAAFLLWGFAKTVAPVYVFAILFGFLGGGFTSTWTLAATECAGSIPELNPIVFGCFAATKGVAAVVGPLVAGILRQSASSKIGGAYGRFGFGRVELFVGACALATGLGGLVVGATRRVRKR